MTKTIVGLFGTMDDAQRAVQALMDSGIDSEDISLIAADRRGEVVRQNAVGSAAGDGAGAGALGGTVLGGALGLLVGAGLLAIPGIGPVLAAGPLAAAIGTAAATAGAGALGAGLGAATGGLIGGLIGAGVPEEDARIYAESVGRGEVLVSASVDAGSAGFARDQMRRYGAIDIESRRITSDLSAPTAGAGDTAYDRMPADESPPGGTAFSGGDYARGMREDAVSPARPDYARGMHSYGDYEGDFRQHHRASYGATGRPYDQYSPAYRYGHSLAGDQAMARGQRWEDIELDARRSWEHDHPNTWEEFKDTVRYAWERARGLR